MKLTDENRVWHVTTEGDCEGRSIKDFGYFKGNLMEIAKRLGGHQYYALDFSEFKLSDYPTSRKLTSEVNLRVNLMDERRLIKQLKEEGYDVQNAQYYKAVKMKITPDEVDILKREAALDKLSDEEKILLGLV